MFKEGDFMELIKIAYAPDENYVGLTVVSMVSVLDNNKDEDIEFIILHSGLSKAAIRKLEWVKSYKPCKIRYVLINREEFVNYPTVCWVSTATWFRIKIADTCPDCNKVLYLDSDTMVRGSLRELFDMDISDNYVAAVDFSCPKHLKLKNDGYFNAGVILFNCKTWREENVFKITDDYVQANKSSIKYADQDVLNIISNERKFSLPKEYNYCENHFRKDNNFERMDDAKIVHFTGPNPNRFTCINSFKPEWVEYAMKTPYYDEFVNQNAYNIALTYKKHKNNLKRYSLLSKITFGSTKEKYLEKAFTTKLILDSLKY